MTTSKLERNLTKNRFRSFLFQPKGEKSMPLFTTKPVDQLFERFMKHQPTGLVQVSVDVGCGGQVRVTQEVGHVDQRHVLVDE